MGPESTSINTDLNTLSNDNNVEATGEMPINTLENSNTSLQTTDLGSNNIDNNDPDSTEESHKRMSGI
jgi:hypothetical protein